MHVDAVKAMCVACRYPHPHPKQTPRDRKGKLYMGAYTHAYLSANITNNISMLREAVRKVVPRSTRQAHPKPLVHTKIVIARTQPPKLTVWRTQAQTHTHLTILKVPVAYSLCSQMMNTLNIIAGIGPPHITACSTARLPENLCLNL